MGPWERISIQEGIRAGRTLRSISDGIGFSRSSVSREVARGWAEGCEISGCPPEAEDRAVPGHWEGDLVIGGDLRSRLVALVERKTRYLEMRALPAHGTRTAVDLLIETVADVPESVRSSVLSTLAWDQGCELADHARFTEGTGFKVYFCDPRSPWQKGANENADGLIRRYFPKGAVFADVDPERVRHVQGLLNSRPRETLGWRTPAEALAQVASEASEAVQ